MKVADKGTCKEGDKETRRQRDCQLSDRVWPDGDRWTWRLDSVYCLELPLPPAGLQR